MKKKLNRMKKIIFVILVVCSTLCMCGNKSSAQGQNFFFEDPSKEIKYTVEHSFSDTVLPESSLQIMMVSQYEHGKLYRIKCGFAEDFPGRYQNGFDRLSLGYFYVQDYDHRIYRIREEDVTDEIMSSEEEISSAGTVVCQEEEKKDPLGEEEAGLHEWITTDGDRREYHSYNNRTETGFYESFVWERGRGLIYYTSGFGAARDMIELVIKD